MAAAGGLIAALILARTLFGKADLTMALNGALAGLVSITAEPLSGTNIESMLIGAVGGLLVVLSIVALDKMRIDDPVGAISVRHLRHLGLDGGTDYHRWRYSGRTAYWLRRDSWLYLAAALVVWFVIKMIFGIRLSEEDQMVARTLLRLASLRTLNSPSRVIAIGSAKLALRVKSRLRAAFCVVNIQLFVLSGNRTFKLADRRSVL